MDSLPDPEALRERSDVPFRDEQTVDEPISFDYFADVGGLVAVGVTNDAGEVLLMESRTAGDCRTDPSKSVMAGSPPVDASVES